MDAKFHERTRVLLSDLTEAKQRRAKTYSQGNNGRNPTPGSAQRLQRPQSAAAAVSRGPGGVSTTNMNQHVPLHQQQILQQKLKQQQILSQSQNFSHLKPTNAQQRPSSSGMQGNQQPRMQAATLGHSLGLASYMQGSFSSAHTAHRGPQAVRIRTGGNQEDADKNYIWNSSQGTLKPPTSTNSRASEVPSNGVMNANPIRPKSATASAESATPVNIGKGKTPAVPSEAPSWSTGRYFTMPSERGARPRHIVQKGMHGASASNAVPVATSISRSASLSTAKQSKSAPPSEESAAVNPTDGVLFTDENEAGIPVVHRTAAARQKNPERMNLDRRGLTVVPIIENEPKLRLLNMQHNKLNLMTNLRLPNLVFLDLYDNRLTDIGSLEGLPMLRVLMLGRNRISRLNASLAAARHLDVLDLHANELTSLEDIGSLALLRVLNVAGNKLTEIRAHHIRGLRSLTELNVRRNKICNTSGIRVLPSLQHVFLSNNALDDYESIEPVLKCKNLTELTLDGNDAVTRSLGESIQDYRQEVVRQLPNLQVLDLLPVSESERKQKVKYKESTPSATGISLQQPEISVTKEIGAENKSMPRDAASFATSLKTSTMKDTPQTSYSRSTASTLPLHAPSLKGGNTFISQHEGMGGFNSSKESTMKVRYASDFLCREIDASESSSTNCEPLQRWIAVRSKLVDPEFMSALQLDLLDHQISETERRKGFYEVDASGPCSTVKIYGRVYDVLQNAEVMREATAVELQQSSLDDLVVHALPHLPAQVSRVTLLSPRIESLRDLAAIAQVMPHSVASVSIKVSPIVCIQFYRPWLIFHLPMIGVLDGVVVTPGEREAAKRLLQGLLQSVMVTLQGDSSQGDSMMGLRPYPGSISLQSARARQQASRIASKCTANILQRAQRRATEELEFQSSFDVILSHSLREAHQEQQLAKTSEYWDRTLQNLRAGSTSN